MTDTIRIGICGYGNLGRGVEKNIQKASDMDLVGVFTRRPPETLETIFQSTKVYHVDDLKHMTDDIDVLILCGGSATDLTEQSPMYGKLYNIVDSFDNHSKIPEHMAKVNQAAKENNHTAVISAGWDPGLFSLNRLIAEAVLPEGDTYTFWGKGVSQGHSDAIRRIEGVSGAVQYTIPIEEALEKVREGTAGHLTAGEKHKRQCFVVPKEGADRAKITEEIVNMPAYFKDYDTEVNFITKEELEKNHKAMPHGGKVIRTGFTASNEPSGEYTKNKHLYEFSLDLESNPEFTSSVLLAYARACFKMSKMGNYGAKSVLEIPPYLLSPKSIDQLYKEIL